jgi:hypothetical protein
MLPTFMIERVAMKNILPLFLMCIGLSFANANDTLTRFDIYNFNVGDTFDYKRVLRYDVAGIYQTGYYRHVVIGKYLNPSQDTIAYTLIYSTTGQSYISTYTDLDTFEILTPPFDSTCTAVSEFDTLAGTGIVTNSIEVSCYGTSKSVFGEGLGQVLYADFTFDGDGIQADTTELIYFSKGSQKWGTPYTLFTDVPDIVLPEFLIYPNPTFNAITIQTGSVLSEQAYFNVFDVNGNVLLMQPVTSQTTKVSLNELSKGLYFYNVSQRNSRSTTRKLIIN